MQCLRRSYFFLIFFIKAYVDAIQMGTRNVCLYKEVDKKYTSCNVKTMEWRDCAQIGVCAVIRSNTIFYFFCYIKKKAKQNLMEDKRHPTIRLGPMNL